MYIDEIGGLWLDGPGGALFAIALLGLVVWAQNGLTLAPVQRLFRLRPGRAVRDRRPARPAAGDGLELVQFRRRPARLSARPQPTQAGLAVRAQRPRTCSAARQAQDEGVDLKPVA